ncbi:hypothetical protein LEN26_016495 [Aphanomyces euteiches]|nr:hypothetical protein LEN26_016495 [Aphanomyces euteiches]KAH9110660.1 hypothetical protein AeMF1_014611 [Aphanomyces euteiches]
MNGTKTRRARPTLAEKMRAIACVRETSYREAAKITGWDKSSLREWVVNVDKLNGFNDSKARRKNTGNCGAKTIISDSYELALYVRDLRRDEKAVTTGHLINFLRVNHNTWLEDYITTRSSGYKSLLRLLQHFAHRHDFTRQRICRQERTQVDLEATRLAFANDFADQYGDLPLDCLFNADETGIYFDMAPNTILAVRGGGSYVANGEKHSSRMTALLTIRADGLKLPIVFIIRGADGGLIESNEFESYPQVHFYYMQKKAWMNGVVWKKYLRDVLHDHIQNPSVLLVDNFDSHVSDESQRINGEELRSVLYALPPNSTSHCQPLDVSIMGPFKQHLRDLWIMSQETDTTAPVTGSCVAGDPIVA